MCQIDEHRPAGYVVSNQTAADPDSDELQYTIVAGNESNAFAIDSGSGEITVNNTLAIDFEAQNQFNLQIEASDNLGLFALHSLIIDVANINEAPSLSAASNASVYVENDDPVLVSADAAVQDVDSAQLVKAVVTIANHKPSEDQLSVDDTPNISSNFDAATGRLILTGPASIAEFNTIVQQIRYSNLSDNPNTEPRILEMTLFDASNAIVSDLSEVQLIEVNDLAVGNPAIVGVAEFDTQLVADTTNMQDADSIVGYSYQWMRDGADLAGETGSSYLVSEADANSAVSVRVSIIDANGRDEPWMESAHIDIPPLAIEPEPELATAQPITNPIEIEFEPIEPQSLASILSAETPNEQEPVATDSAQDTDQETQPLTNNETATESDQSDVASQQLDQTQLLNPFALTSKNKAVSSIDLRSSVNPIVASEIKTIHREIKLESIGPDEHPTSVLSLEPLTLNVDENTRIQWQAQNHNLSLFGLGSAWRRSLSQFVLCQSYMASA